MLFGISDNVWAAISCVVMVLLVMSMMGIFSRKPKYIKPTASIKSDGIIEIKGDVTVLQSKMHSISSGGTWVHKGQHKWEYHVPHSHDKSHQQYIVEAINNSSENL